MDLKITAYGIAKDILGQRHLAYQAEQGLSIKALKDELCKTYPAFKDLASLRMAVDEEYREDDYILKSNDQVVIIPPVSGG